MRSPVTWLGASGFFFVSVVYILVNYGEVGRPLWAVWVCTVTSIIAGIVGFNLLPLKPNRRTIQRVLWISFGALFLIAIGASMFAPRGLFGASVDSPVDINYGVLRLETRGVFNGDIVLDEMVTIESYWQPHTRTLKGLWMGSQVCPFCRLGFTAGADDGAPLDLKVGLYTRKTGLVEFRDAPSSGCRSRLEETKPHLIEGEMECPSLTIDEETSALRVLFAVVISPGKQNLASQARDDRALSSPERPLETTSKQRVQKPQGQKAKGPKTKGPKTKNRARRRCKDATNDVRSEEGTRIKRPKPGIDLRSVTLRLSDRYLEATFGAADAIPDSSGRVSPEWGDENYLLWQLQAWKNPDTGFVLTVSLERTTFRVELLNDRLDTLNLGRETLNVSGNSVTVSIPRSEIRALGNSFRWWAGTEYPGNPFPTLNQDDCPDLGADNPLTFG